LTHVKIPASINGQVVLPVERRAEGDVERVDRDARRLVRIEARNEGLVDWLLSCPVKGYFVPIESGSTHAL
jgi:hypothetical protein